MKHVPNSIQGLLIGFALFLIVLIIVFLISPLIPPVHP